MLVADCSSFEQYIYVNIANVSFCAGVVFSLYCSRWKWLFTFWYWSLFHKYKPYSRTCRLYRYVLELVGAFLDGGEQHITENHLLNLSTQHKEQLLINKHFYYSFQKNSLFLFLFCFHLDTQDLLKNLVLDHTFTDKIAHASLWRGTDIPTRWFQKNSARYFLNTTNLYYQIVLRIDVKPWKLSDFVEMLGY